MKRVKAEIYRNLVLMFRNKFRLFDITVWPLILFFSLTLFIQFVNPDPNIFAVVIVGVIGWRAVYHMQIEANTTFMDHYWDKTLPHTMASPLSVFEMICSAIIMGFVKLILVASMIVGLSSLLFHFHIANLAIFFMAILVLCMAGIILGMITFGIVLLYNEHAIAFSWAIPDLVVLLSGAYYPIAIFPTWVQHISALLPPFWGFELMKSMYGFGQVNFPLLILSLAIWFVLAGLFLHFCYKKAKKDGRIGKFM
jgi:ABC-type multidrug transport system permease subunit